MGNTDNVRNDIHGVMRKGKKTTANSFVQAVEQAKGSVVGHMNGHSPTNNYKPANDKAHGMSTDNYGLKNEVDAINLHQHGGQSMTKPVPYMNEPGYHMDYGIDNVRTNGTDYKTDATNIGLKNEDDGRHLAEHPDQHAPESHKSPAVIENPEVVKANEPEDDKKEEQKGEDKGHEDEKAEDKSDDKHHHDLEKLPLYTLHEKSDPSVTFTGPGVLIVSLEEDPSKQMKWVLEEPSDMFKLHDESKKDESSTSQLRVFRILTEQGTGDLNFSYVNPWKDVAPEKTLTFSVNANG